MCGTKNGHLVTCTVMKPVTVTETRVKNCVVTKEVEREETYTVYRRVEESREFKRKVCFLDDEIKSKKITEESCRVVQNPVIQTYRVKVPVCEQHTEMVQAEQCMDGQMVLVEEPCTKCVTREREEVRTRECTEPQVVWDQKTCTIDYCVKVPKTREVPCTEETVLKLEPVIKTRKVTVCVPEIERQTYDVQVTKMFPETVCVCEHCAAKMNKKCSDGQCGGGGGWKAGLSKLKQWCKR